MLPFLSKDASDDASGKHADQNIAHAAGTARSAGTVRLAMIGLSGIYGVAFPFGFERVDFRSHVAILPPFE